MKNIVESESGSYLYYCQIGNDLQQQKQYDSALQAYLKAISINSSEAYTYIYSGNMLYYLNRYSESLNYYLQAIEINPKLAAAYNCVGIALFNLEKNKESLKYYKKAIEIEPENYMFYYNMGYSYEALFNFNEAINCFRKSVELKPDYVEAHYILSNLLMRQSDFSEGLKEYEWRLLKPEVKDKVYEKPYWDGSNPAGKTIYVHYEQGLGDTLQFACYLKILRDAGANVVFRCQPKLKKLLKNSVGFDQLISLSKTPDYDYHIPLISLARVFGIQPIQKPYIYADKELSENWKNYFSAFKGFKIGICWEPKASSVTYEKRRCDLKLFHKLTEIQGITLFSLQKGLAENQTEMFPEIVNLSSNINSFSDTAAIIDNLDLVISIDTSVAHLAGAMGKTVWMLLPYLPDWRWGIEGEACQWYPTMTLLRQPSVGNWDKVFDVVYKRIKQLISHDNK